MVNCGPFQSTAALTTVVATYPPPSAMCQASCTCIPRAACTQLAGVRVSKKDLVLQIWVICVLAVCWLCKEVSSTIAASPCIVAIPSSCGPSDSQGTYSWCPSSYLCHFSFLIPLGTRYYQTRTFRNNFTYGEIRKWLQISGGEKVAENIPNLMKDVNINIQVSQWLQVKWIWKDPDQDTL